MINFAQFKGCGGGASVHCSILCVCAGIELPQLELTDTFTADCTAQYSTGNFTCLEVVFKLKRRLGSVGFIPGSISIADFIP